MIQGSLRKTRQCCACVFWIQQINIITEEMQRFMTFFPFYDFYSLSTRWHCTRAGFWKITFHLADHWSIHPSTPHLSSQPKTHNLLQEMKQVKQKKKPKPPSNKPQNNTTTSPIYEITGLRNLSIMQLPLQMKRLCHRTQKGNEM